jgi:hypothetical protein
MTHTVESIQSWIDSYTFVDNPTASKDILENIVRSLPGHGYLFGPTESGGYTLKINGDVIVNKTFVLQADKA